MLARVRRSVFTAGVLTVLGLAAACSRDAPGVLLPGTVGQDTPSQPIPVITDALREHMRRAGIRLTKPKPWAPPKGLDRASSPLADGQELDLDFEGLGAFTVVGETYAALGVIFYNADVIDTLLVSGWTAVYPPRSGSSVMIPDQDSYDPVVRVMTDVPVRSVGVYATSYFPVTLTCYDESGVAIGADSMDFTDLSYSDYFRGLVSGIYANHHLQVAHAGIRSCGVGGNAKYYSLDDFEFNKTAAGGLTLKCIPSTVVRGQPVSCTLATTQVGGVQILALTASTKYGNVIWPGGDQLLQPGDTLRWQGAAVTSSVVKAITVSGSSGTDTLTASDSFHVSPRLFARWQVGSPTETTALYPQAMREEPWHDKVGWHFVLGINVMREVSFQPGGDAPVAADTTGPNAGIFYFVRMPSLRPDSIFVHPQLHGVHGIWWSEQQGNQYWPLTAGDSLRECDNRTNDVANLAAAVDAHEGVTMAAGSHWANAKYYYERVPMDSVLEGMAVKSNSGDLLAIADSIYRVAVVRPLAAADSALDTPQAYDNVWRAVGCKPDIVIDGH